MVQEMKVKAIEKEQFNKVYKILKMLGCITIEEKEDVYKLIFFNGDEEIAKEEFNGCGNILYCRPPKM